jgi:exosortase/archaeosortase family protein
METTQRKCLFSSAAAVLAGMLLLGLMPLLKIRFFAGASAQLASLFLGTPVLRIEEGWLLPYLPEPVLVTAACSGVDFWLMVTALCAWQFSRSRSRIIIPALFALICAAPLSIAVNAIRIALVAQAHRWFIPLWPAAYAPFLHLLTGAAVFLPALIILHVILETHRSSRAHRNH